MYNITNILDTRSTKPEVDSLICNIGFDSCYTQTETQTHYFVKHISPYIITVKQQWVL